MAAVCVGKIKTVKTAKRPRGKIKTKFFVQFFYFVVYLSYTGLKEPLITCIIFVIFLSTLFKINLELIEKGNLKWM